MDISMRGVRKHKKKHQTYFWKKIINEPFNELLFQQLAGLYWSGRCPKIRYVVLKCNGIELLRCNTFNPISMGSDSYNLILFRIVNPIAIIRRVPILNVRSTHTSIHCLLFLQIIMK